MSRSSITRRTALKAGAAALAAPAIVPAGAFGANEKLNIGVIGVGGRGQSDLNAVSTESIVALCDVDEQRLGAAANRHPGAKTYHDYRQLLEQDNLDAVVVATPDHHHAPATMRAMNRGLHVYCEKPLTHTVEEARKIAQVATVRKLATQMGTQNHEHPGYVRLVELLRGGAIGDVRQVHVMTDRPGRWWSQGMDRPAQTQKVPSHLHWNLWLGPARERSYHEAYVPFRWRGWWDFGCGAIGDMAIHLLDPTFQALNLGGRPVRVASQGPPLHAHSGPKHMTTKFTFPAQKDSVELSVYWYEGTTKPPHDIAAKLPMNGSLFVGSDGEIAIEHGQQPQLLDRPETDGDGAAAGQESSPFSQTHHHQQWITACKTGSATGSNFGYAGPFTEVVLLGNVAYRVGREIEYDPVEMSTGDREADLLLRKDYRPGWALS
ncbi:MAG: Gfo/Idh/MocA family oxidoreductase [Fuerstiella sp.]|jgi:predicted dehydrogenase|nr:Gfo/Idh/MocA family oxidoreductase [Fuerstiella sp.]MCP4511191.1 Gfo/Idh/MocA family oxidoreductase [Fuerstiella sp.]MDG2129917.1 Gfo/Idh/MocA family oxidoreductase [Fuerstiella sp.]